MKLRGAQVFTVNLNIFFTFFLDSKVYNAKIRLGYRLSVQVFVEVLLGLN